MEHFDYIIAGGGCSGRSLAVRMLPYLRATNKRVLIIDKEDKVANDKTWCFWEKESDIFEPVVYKKWNRLSFSSTLINQELDIHPYQYKMIRSVDFYAYTDKHLYESKHIIKIQGNVERLYMEKDLVYVVIGENSFSADYAFSSIPQIHKKNTARYQYLLQHFHGWVIKTNDEVFNVDCATLMDFNTPQQAGTSFVYVLPLSANRALVEYTIFSEEELKKEDYATALKEYIHKQLHCDHYTIEEAEYGVIPMSDHPIPQQQDRIIYLGTAGGFTKGSTGYTFRFIQKHTAAIVKQLLQHGNPHISSISPQRFNTYDATLLHLLASRHLSGEEIFSTMFRKNKAAKILKFLDNETSIVEEIKIFSTLQKRAFAMALLQRTLKLMKSY